MSENRESERAKIISKIEKLLALSNSPNENEAIAALEKAQALLAEHNLSLSELGTKSDPMIKDNDLLTDLASWIKPLLNEVAKLYFCGYFFEKFPADWIKKNGFDRNARYLFTGYRGRVFLRHSFIGERANIIVAKNMAEYLISTMERICKKERKAYPTNERVSFSISFMNACAARLQQRLKERRERTSESGIQTNGTNLPALRSLYQQAEDQVQAWLDNDGTKLRKKKNLAIIRHQGGAHAGIKAGNTIGLDDQVEHHHSRRITAQ